MIKNDVYNDLVNKSIIHNYIKNSIMKKYESAMSETYKNYNLKHFEFYENYLEDSIDKMKDETIHNTIEDCISEILNELLIK